MKDCYASKDTINKGKDTTHKWGKFISNHITHKGLTSRIYKNYYINNKSTNKTNLKRAKDLNGHFYEENT